MTRPVFFFSPFISAVGVISCLLQAVIVPAQTHKVAAPERVTRAIAVYEWTGPLEKPTADRLVPVSLFIGGRMESADVYLARPVPLSLQTGNVYEVDEAGLKKGTFDVDHARNSRSFMKEVADTGASGWYGFGSFRAPSAATKIPVLQTSKTLPTISSTGDSARPRFATKADKDTASASDPTKKPEAGSQTDDPDKPKLNRPSDQAAQSSPDKSKDDDVDRPTLRKRDPAEDAERRKAASTSGVRGPDVSLNDDPDRPTMRHGKPTVENAQDLTGLPADMHQTAAVSDAANRPDHLFAREWESATERADTLFKLQALARPLVAKYIAANQLTPGEPAPPAASPALAPLPAAVTTPPTSSDDENAPKLQRGVPKDYQKPSSAVKPAARANTPAATHRNTAASKHAPTRSGASPLTLNSEQLTPYTLSYGGLPTFVYTAQASLKTGGLTYVTLVAQRMVTGELQVSLSSVTDASHLDRTPWMRLVDAVDPDASHRASLLFELRGQSTRQFALYRLTSAQAEQTFITNTM